jgi:RNA polymerase sigma-70 factor (ECF subfamily)
VSVPTHSSDLLLARACAAGEDAALTRLDREFLEPARANLRRLGFDDDLAAEAVQRVRVTAVLGTPTTPPALLGYRASGPLRAWLRTAIVREAIRLRRHADAPAPAPPPGPDDSPLSAAHDRQHFSASVRTALLEAFRSLTPAQRNLLRQRVLEQRKLTDLAREHGVHEATVARWIAGARHDLSKALRTRLRRSLCITASECESILHDLQSHLPVSMRTALGSGLE